MNIAQAKQISLPHFVEQFGGRFSHKDAEGNLWYFSMFRPDEQTASLKIDPRTNKWHDFGRTQKVDAHGDIIDAWTDYHNLPRRESNSIKQALSALRQEFASPLINVPRNITERKSIRPISKAPPRYKITKLGNIWVDSLKKEVANRKLSLDLLQPYLKQARIIDTKPINDGIPKNYYGFAFPNDKGGYEISIPNTLKPGNFKTVIGTKAITAIENPTQTSACVFEGFWDCFTWLAMNRELKELPTLYVLNSVSLVLELANKIINHKNHLQSIFLFMDNDAAGLKAQTALLDLLEPHDLKVGTMNHIYEGYKDVSDAWVNKSQSNVSNAKIAFGPAQCLKMR